jgi:hypothetical protein
MPGVAPYATDVDQFRQILSGTADVGTITFAGPLALPASPTLAMGAAGVLNGTYKYLLVTVTGWVENNGTIHANGFAPSAEGTIAVSSKQVTVTLPSLAAPVVAYVVYRTAAGGATSSEKFLAAISNGSTSYTDNLADSSLGIGMPSWSGTSIPSSVPSVNTTGTPVTMNSPLTVNNNVTINGNLNASNFPKVSVSSVINSTSPLTVATLTPVNTGNFEAKVYLGTVATDTYTVSVFWTDQFGLQANMLVNAQSFTAGSYNLPTIFFTAVAGSPITIVVTSAVTGNTYIGASIVGV